jgi:hypothetical protein
MPAFDKPDRLSLQVAALRLPPSRQDSRSAQTAACCGTGWLSFRRIVYIPFDACVAALEGLLREGTHGEIHVGQSRLRGPVKHDRRSGTCQAEVRLARGPLRPALRMRLNIDCWSPPPSTTALELIPRRRVRASASYFRAGHLLMDSLIHSLQPERQMQVPGCPAGEEPETDAVRSGSRSADSPDLPRPYAPPGRPGEPRVGGLYLSCMTRQSEDRARVCMSGQETVPAINANSAAHLSRPHDPPVGNLVVKELQRDMLKYPSPAVCEERSLGRVCGPTASRAGFSSAPQASGDLPDRVEVAHGDVDNKVVGVIVGQRKPTPIDTVESDDRG